MNNKGCKCLKQKDNMIIGYMDLIKKMKTPNSIKALEFHNKRKKALESVFSGKVNMKERHSLKKNKLCF